jgi:hypothetical protein
VAASGELAQSGVDWPGSARAKSCRSFEYAEIVAGDSPRSMPRKVR